MLAIALGALLLFSVLAFAATEQWALSLFQAGIFILGVVCAMRRNLRFTPVAFALAAVVVWTAMQLYTGTTAYRFATANAFVNSAAYLVLYLSSLPALQ